MEIIASAYRLDGKYFLDSHILCKQKFNPVRMARMFETLDINNHEFDKRKGRVDLEIELIGYNVIKVSKIFTDTIEDIIKRGCEYFGTPIELLISETREDPTCKQRQMLMCNAHYLTKASLSVIGESFGRKNHATVLHSIKKAIPSRIISKDKDVLEWIDYFQDVYDIENYKEKILNADF